MGTLLLGGVGVVFTALLLAVPSLHLAAWTGTGLPALSAALIALPLLVLLLAVLRPIPGLLVFGFPVAHLPALVHEPQLTRRLVESGPSGLAALGAIAAVGAAWFAVAMRNDASPAPARPAAAADEASARRITPAARALTRLVLVLSLAVFGAFVAAAFARPDADPLAANITLLVGVAAAWYGVGRVFTTTVGDLLYEPREPRRLGATGRAVVMRLLVVQGPGPSELWATAILLALAAAVAFVWYLLYGG